MERADPRWPRAERELIAAQLALARTCPPLWRAPAQRPQVAGCWICFPRGLRGRGEAGDPAWAAAALQDGDRTTATTATAVARGHASAPYEPGLLALREGPLLEAAVRALDRRPDVLLVNASGADHPRAAGLALHLGQILDLPTVGVTDRPLLATGDPPRPTRGDTAPLTLDNHEVARWLTTRRNARPLVIHAGWRTDLDTAVAIVSAATSHARTPAPLRAARTLARRARASADDDRR